MRPRRSSSRAASAAILGIAALVVLGGCDAPAPEAPAGGAEVRGPAAPGASSEEAGAQAPAAPASAGSAAPAGSAGAPASAPSAAGSAAAAGSEDSGGAQAPAAAAGTAPAPPGASLPSEAEGLEVARGLLEASARGEAGAWLEGAASFPLELDSKAVVPDAASLPGALAAHMPDLDAQLRPHTTCDAITREALLRGEAPWPWLDRLGARPPQAALARDLARLGVQPTDLIINCHAKDAAGFTLLVTRLPEGARLRSIKN